MSHLPEMQESTLVDSSTTSSVDAYSRDIASYIEPRDPSITNPWMRPRPPHGTNLGPLFDNSATPPEEDQHLKVYLRIKPILETKKENDLYEIQDKSLITMSHCVKKQYNFSHIFSPLNTQVQLFNTMIKDNLLKFVEMNDFTLLTYGSSGSGKTYSLMGTDSQPGVIPRCLEFLFARVQPDKYPLYKPCDGNSLQELAPAVKERETQITESIVKTCSSAQTLAGLDNYRRMSRCLSRESRYWMDLRHPVHRYEVWVSFVEIYNESVHDLLRTEPACRMQAPPKLKIVQSATQQPYIKGIRWVCVRSGVEAYATLVYGKRRLRYAHTNINSHSSRSHCLFTLKLVMYKSGIEEHPHLQRLLGFTIFENLFKHNKRPKTRRWRLTNKRSLVVSKTKTQMPSIKTLVDPGNDMETEEFPIPSIKNVSSLQTSPSTQKMATVEELTKCISDVSLGISSHSKEGSCQSPQLIGRQETAAGEKNVTRSRSSSQLSSLSEEGSYQSPQLICRQETVTAEIHSAYIAPSSSSSQLNRPETRPQILLEDSTIGFFDESVNRPSSARSNESSSKSVPVSFDADDEEESHANESMSGISLCSENSDDPKNKTANSDCSSDLSFNFL